MAGFFIGNGCWWHGVKPRGCLWLVLVGLWLVFGGCDGGAMDTTTEGMIDDVGEEGGTGWVS
jgi:hypothetical protein